MSESIAVPGLPTPLRPIDPAGASVTYNAPALVLPAVGSWMLTSRVSADHKATFDAAVLVIHADRGNWAKLCLELSPGGEVMVVSVVTRGESDDCNSVPIDGGAVWLRISSLGRAFAFHASGDGHRWDMIRYFGLSVPASIETGFLAQSPTGAGCRATFEAISFTSERLVDVRSAV